MAAKQAVQQAIDSAPVVVFSKTFCPYCKKAKSVLDSLISGKYKVLELDTYDSTTMNQYQDALGEITGARSVPRVFIGGKFIGGGDDVAAKNQSGELKQLLQQVHVL